MTTTVSSSSPSGLVPLFRPIRQEKGANDASGSFLSSFRTDTLELKPGFGHGCCARLWAPPKHGGSENPSWKIQWVCPQFLDLGDAMDWLQTRFHAEIRPKIAASVNLGRRMLADARPGEPQGVSDWGDKNNTNMQQLLCPNII